MTTKLPYPILTGIVIIALFMIYATCNANDGFSGLGAGGLEFKKTNAITIRKELLVISPYKIKVSYEFYNHTSNAINTLVAFPINDVFCDGIHDTNIPDQFSTWVNGKRVRMHKESRAFYAYDEKIIKSRFRKNQPLAELLGKHNIPADCRKIDVKHFSRLRKLKLMAPEGDPPTIYFTSNIKYYWKQSFPPKAIIRITHQYRPSISGSLYGLDTNDKTYRPYLTKYLDRFLSTSDATRKLAHRFQIGHSKGISTTGHINVNYILTTANTWSGPIRQFTLVIQNPGHFVLTNFPGPFRITKSGELIFQRKNFRPGRELSIAYFDTNQKLDLDREQDNPDHPLIYRQKLKANAFTVSSLCKTLSIDNGLILHREGNHLYSYLHNIPSMSLSRLQQCIYAKHDYLFPDVKIQKYFKQRFAHYSPQIKNIQLSQSDEINIRFLQRIIDKRVLP